MVTAHPGFDQLQMGRVSYWIRDRHLVRTPGAFQPLTVNLLWTGPSFRSSQYDHWPSWTDRIGRVAVSRVIPNFANFQNAALEGRGHQLMHRLRLVALHHVWLVSISKEEAF